MIKHIIYGIFGAFVIGSYFTIARTGTVFSSARVDPTPPTTRILAGAPRVRPDFWSPGYLGGK